MRENVPSRMSRIVGTHARVETLGARPLLAEDESRTRLLDVVSRLRSEYKFKLYAISVIDNAFELVIGPPPITAQKAEQLTASMLLKTIKGLYAAITTSVTGVHKRVWELGSLMRTIFTAEEIRHSINSVNYLAVREGLIQDAGSYKFSTLTNPVFQPVRSTPLPVKLGDMPIEVSGSMRAA